MSLPGMFVEYLITGALGLSWLWFIWSFLFPESTLPFEKLSAGHVTFAAPLAYVLGMWIDLVGKRVIKAIAWTAERIRILPPVDTTDPFIQAVAFQTIATETAFQPASAKTRILVLSEKIGEKFELRKSRERVARGAFANVLLASVASLIFIRTATSTQIASGTAAAIGLTCWSFAVWFKFARLAAKFRFNALRELAGIAPTVGPTTEAGEPRLPVMPATQTQPQSVPESPTP